jgi:dTDP-4-amino-4,6-dideoxygalactose transaminase
MNDCLAIHGGTPVRTTPFPAAYDYGDDDVAAVTAVLRKGNETGSISRGPEQALFEREFADRHGSKYAIFVNSGTSAFHTIFGAINPDPGDEVICTPWTSGGSLAGALFQGCVPVFADVDDSYCVDPIDVEAKITPRTRAIIAVHMFGNPCDMDA